MPAQPTIDDQIDQVIARRHVRPILLGEDDAEMRAMLADPLREDGYDLLEARDGTELVRAIHRFEDAMVPLGLIITDVRMPGFSGLEVLEYLDYARLTVPVIVMTAFGDDDTHAQAHRRHAALVLDKPFDIDDLRAAVARLLPRAAAT